ncbi:MAG: sodium:solute symporter [Lewinellaceae bacterium]|nr:sodium:solute symporter [Saprospiraceae bacterium]MCB9306478.1 sodium:solute symporter [Lewinellaceae bacterium]MCB9355462.1 sodium:solute symporter [Lewinellaceae bacterium]
MEAIDWIVLVSTLALVVIYGLWKSRNVATSENFLAGKRDLPWWTIGLSIMATQASAITFLSTPGQGFSDGMQFVQYYFGLPIAMVFLSIFVLPVYYRLRVTTAYEYLEQRFDLRMRTLTAVLFLLQRGMAAAISIYAPSIILSAVFNWNLAFTNFLMAVFVVIYTTSGGSSAVSRTQELQMTIMLSGLVLAFFLVLNKLPEGVGLTEAWQIAGVTGKTKVIDWSFHWQDRYNVWSGILGATFLFLSYFGTDQSQVGRYLSGKSLKESRFGLLFNGLIKIPMQFLVLSVGVMVFVFYQFNQPPLYFNQSNRAKMEGTEQSVAMTALEQRDNELFLQKQQVLNGVVGSDGAITEQARADLYNIEQERVALRKEATGLVKEALPASDPNDKDFIFINFILTHMPTGLIGLMLAMIFCGAWSTTASEISALTATTVSDIYRRSLVPGRDDNHYFRVSKFTTVIWGAIIMVFAIYFDLFDNLIQAVNMIGSIFYGTILGIFFTAFFLKNVGGRAVFWASVITQAIILWLFFGVSKDPFLWYNPLGCGLVMGLSLILEKLLKRS